MEKRVVITGLNGFVGRHCIEPLLAGGYDVHGLGRSERPAWLADAVGWRQVDLLDASAASAAIRAIRPTHFGNLAWYNAHGQYWRSPENAAWIAASLTMMRTFADAGGGRFVGAGTCAEYDWRYGFLTEDLTPIEPRTPFGHSKAALSRASSAFAECADLSFAWGRIFFVYGPHEGPERLAASVIGALLQGRPVKTTEGRQIRDFSHVQDIATGFVALIDSDVRGTVNLASGEPTRVRDLVTAIVDVVGGRDLVSWGAIPLAAHEPPLLVGDVRRLRNEVGFTPVFDLEGGLADTIASFRRNL